MEWYDHDDYPEYRGSDSSGGNLMFLIIMILFAIVFVALVSKNDGKELNSKTYTKEKVECTCNKE